MPVMLRIPEVVGVRLSGRLPDGTLATDLALTVTEQLRRLGLSGQFVEFFGPGLSSLSAGDRAVVANMAPEYGASSGFFPVDEQTIAYLRRDRAQPVAGRSRRGLCEAAVAVVRSRRHAPLHGHDRDRSRRRSASPLRGHAGRRIGSPRRRPSQPWRDYGTCRCGPPARMRPSLPTAPSPSPPSRAARIRAIPG